MSGNVKKKMVVNKVFVFDKTVGDFRSYLLSTAEEKNRFEEKLTENRRIFTSSPMLAQLIKDVI